MDTTTNSILSQIEAMIDDIPGWSPVDQLYTLYNMLFLTSELEGDVVEIGSWCGRSAVVLGKAAQRIGNTKIHCIDLFPAKNDWQQKADGSYSFTVKLKGKIFEGYQEQTVWQEPFERDIAPLYEKYDNVLEIFSEVIEKYNMKNMVSAHRGDSTTFINSISVHFKCKLAFLDGDHSYKAVCLDIRNIERYLVPGGWICFDDAFSHYEGVNQAITDLIINNQSYELCQQMTRKFFIARKKYPLTMR